MIEIDGAAQSGSGTIVRFGVALAALLGKPLRVENARAKRRTPGLRAQHVAAVRGCAALCDAKVDGVEVGSRAFDFIPRSSIRGGTFDWDIGSAGSATMLALGTLPVACFADAPVHAHIRGGTHQDFAPTPEHMQQVLRPLLARMGLHFDLQVRRPGYVPSGGGELELLVRPARRLRSLVLAEAGDAGPVHGRSLSSHLEARQVSERMARTCEIELGAAGLSSSIERMLDTSAAQPGASLAAWTETSTGCWLGADRPGRRGRSSEAIGRFVAQALLRELAAGATVDRHAADQLILFCALAEGASRFRVARVTPHVNTNLWLVSQFGARARIERNWVHVEGGAA